MATSAQTNSPTAITTEGRSRLSADFPGIIGSAAMADIGLPGPATSVGSKVLTAAASLSAHLLGSVPVALGNSRKAPSAHRENSPFSLQKAW